MATTRLEVGLEDEPEEVYEDVIIQVVEPDRCPVNL